MASNITNVVFPGPFNPKTDNWCNYKEQLLCALDAAGYRDNNLDKARSLFLSQCGKETYSLIASLLVPNRPTYVSLKDIVRVLDQFYKPEVNETLQAGKFHRRQQQQNESVQDFVSAINLLGAKCNFVDLKRQLRDRLVLGVRDDHLRLELLKIKDLTYETALQTCLNHQAALFDLYPEASETTQTNSDVTEPIDDNTILSNDCRHCSRVHKPGEKCQFMKARCFYCKKFGHIVAVCSKRPVRKEHISDIINNGEEPRFGEKPLVNISISSESDDRSITADVMIEGVKVTVKCKQL